MVCHLFDLISQLTPRTGTTVDLVVGETFVRIAPQKTFSMHQKRR